MPQILMKLRAYPFIYHYILVSFFTLIFVVIDKVWMSSAELFISLDSYRGRLFSVVALYMLAAIIYGVSRLGKYKHMTKRLHYNQVAEFIAWAPLIIIYAHAFTILSYLCVSHNSLSSSTIRC
jgi:hypothetical protein